MSIKHCFNFTTASSNPRSSTATPSWLVVSTDPKWQDHAGNQGENAEKTAMCSDLEITGVAVLPIKLSDTFTCFVVFTAK
jgi:hypothetical protein